MALNIREQMTPEQYDEWTRKLRGVSGTIDRLDFLNKALLRIEELLRQPSAPISQPPATSLDSLVKLNRALFMFDPEGALSLVSSHQPNVCFKAVGSLTIALAPGATTTLISPVPQGFVGIVTSMQGFTDIPFAIAFIISRDNEVYYQDAGLVPCTVEFRHWLEASVSWGYQLTNTSIFNVNIHVIVVGYWVEVQTLQRIKKILESLSFAISETGTPEGA